MLQVLEVFIPTFYTLLAYLQTCMHAYLCRYVYACAYICMCILLSMYVYTCVHMCIHMYKCQHRYVYVDKVVDSIQVGVVVSGEIWTKVGSTKQLKFRSWSTFKMSVEPLKSIAFVTDQRHRIDRNRWVIAEVQRVSWELWRKRQLSQEDRTVVWWLLQWLTSILGYPLVISHSYWKWQ